MSDLVQAIEGLLREHRSLDERMDGLERALAEMSKPRGMRLLQVEEAEVVSREDQIAILRGALERLESGE